MTDSKYRSAGVDIDAAADAVNRMTPAIHSTHTDAVLSGTGSFGGLFAIDSNAQNPVLVASIDGVGTKVKLAAQLNQWQGIGYDIVNHCTNDILVQNARPLFFMDYIATSKLHPQQVADVVIGIAEACRAVNCALLAGETAEMPGVYAEGAFDVAGAIVGLVNRERILPLQDAMQAGDVLFGLPSSGPHTNGYSLIRSVVADKDLDAELTNGQTLGSALLEPHRCYVADVDALQAAGVDLLGLAHITGGGLLDNVPRILPEHLAAQIQLDAWETPELFEMLVEWAGMQGDEAYRVFNMGVGMVLVVPADQAPRVNNIVPDAVRIGELTERGAKSNAVQLVHS